MKKIYIEITNKCDLKCSFCSIDNVVKKDMTPSEFSLIVNKIKHLTNFIYIHIKGEPMQHPNLDEILSIATNNGLKVNITTSGINLDLVKNILIKYDIYQINISVHSYKQNKLFNKDYFNKIFNATNFIINNSKTNISYRLWDNDLSDNSDILTKIINHFNLEKEKETILNSNSFKIMKQLYINKDTSFIWPNLNNKYSNLGYCPALSTHFGILVDGTIIPCCLDSSGIINLGNIFIDDIDKILTTGLAFDMRENFKKNKRICELCERCHF